MVSFLTSYFTRGVVLSPGEAVFAAADAGAEVVMFADENWGGYVEYVMAAGERGLKVIPGINLRLDTAGVSPDIPEGGNILLFASGRGGVEALFSLGGEITLGQLKALWALHGQELAVVSGHHNSHIRQSMTAHDGDAAFDFAQILAQNCPNNAFIARFTTPSPLPYAEAFFNGENFVHCNNCLPPSSRRNPQTVFPPLSLGAYSQGKKQQYSNSCSIIAKIAPRWDAGEIMVVSDSLGAWAKSFGWVPPISKHRELGFSAIALAQTTEESFSTLSETLRKTPGGESVFQKKTTRLSSELTTICNTKMAWDFTCAAAVVEVLNSPFIPLFRKGDDFACSATHERSERLLESGYESCGKIPLFFSGRGSAGNSFVAKLLGICSCDPTVFSLSFDRFLHIEKPKPPDFDFDVPSVYFGETIDEIKDLIVEELNKRNFRVSRLRQRASPASLPPSPKKELKEALFSVIEDLWIASNRKYKITQKFAIESELDKIFAGGNAGTRDAIANFPPELLPNETKNIRQITSALHVKMEAFAGQPRNFTPHTGIAFLPPGYPMLPKDGKFLATPYDKLPPNSMKVDLVANSDLAVIADCLVSSYLLQKCGTKKFPKVNLILGSLNITEIGNIKKSLREGNTAGIQHLQPSSDANLTAYKKKLAGLAPFTEGHSTEHAIVTLLREIADKIALARLSGHQHTATLYSNGRGIPKSFSEKEREIARSVTGRTGGTIIYDSQFIALARLFGGVSYAEANTLRKDVLKAKEPLLKAFSETNIEHPHQVTEWLCQAPYLFDAGHALGQACICAISLLLKNTRPSAFLESYSKIGRFSKEKLAFLKEELSSTSTSPAPSTSTSPAPSTSTSPAPSTSTSPAPSPNNPLKK